MDFKDKTTNINISTLTIVKIVIFFLILYFLFIIKDILAILFVSLILSSAIDPWVDWMHNRKIPRGVGVFIIYFIVFGIAGAAIYLIIPPIIQQSGELSNDFSKYLEKAILGFSAFKEYSSQHGLLDNLRSAFGSLNSHIQSLMSGIFSTVTGIFSNIFSLFLILVITFYMVVEENAIKKLVWSLAPIKHQAYIMQLINRMQKKIGLWLRGQIILCLTIFILTYIGLVILGVKYPLVLALIAGLTEFVPYLGPMIGAVPAIFIAFTQSPILALFVAILYYVIQLVENNILVPKVMQKMVGLNPIVSISVLLIGFNIGGIAGAILAIPVATAISVFVQDFFENKEEREKNILEQDNS